MMKPAIVNNQIRIVWDAFYDWVKARGIGGQPVNDMVFDTFEDAYAYLDKFEELKGQIQIWWGGHFPSFCILRPPVQLLSAQSTKQPTLIKKGENYGLGITWNNGRMLVDDKRRRIR